MSRNRKSKNEVSLPAAPAAQPFAGPDQTGLQQMLKAMTTAPQ